MTSDPRPSLKALGAYRQATSRPENEDIHRARAARAYLEVDLDAIENNVSQIRAISGGAKVMAVVKGDAYGMGVEKIAPLLEESDIDAFAVDNVAEALQLRSMGIERDILVLDGDTPDLAPVAIRNRLIPGIATEELLNAYNSCAKATGGPTPVWLYYNCGFNRSGYRDMQKFVELVEHARRCSHIDITGVYSHLSQSFGSSTASEQQISEYFVAVEAAQSVLGREVETSLFATHGIIRWADAYPTDWVRPGVLLYGEELFIDELLEPASAKKMQRFRPAATLKARVIHQLSFDTEETVGYGPDHLTYPGLRLATLAIGYGGGYPAGAHTADVLIAGTRCPLFGAVGMDYLQVDITALGNVEIYGWATLLGRDGTQSIRAKELASASGLSPYSLLRGFKTEIIYIHGGQQQ